MLPQASRLSVGEVGASVRLRQSFNYPQVRRCPPRAGPRRHDGLARAESAVLRSMVRITAGAPMTKVGDARRGWRGLGRSPSQNMGWMKRSRRVNFLTSASTRLRKVFEPMGQAIPRACQDWANTKGRSAPVDRRLQLLRRGAMTSKTANKFSPEV